MNSTESLKQCCARAYESDLVRLLLGESFHPGGIRLTERLGVLLGLRPDSRVLDVASGNGASALYIAERFGCPVVGVDYSAKNVEASNAAADVKGLAGKVLFQSGNAEYLPVDDVSFDAIVCECAFCTFPNKEAAVHEFARVVRPGGGVGLSDLTRGPSLPEELNGLLAWVACIADAQSLSTYASYLTRSGLHVECTESHDDALLDLVNQVRFRLLGAEIAAGLKKIELPEVDFGAAKKMAQAALQAVKEGKLGYGLLCAKA
jgi:arsenite methyltransferase